MKRYIVEILEINSRFNEELRALTPENANSVVLKLGNPSEILLNAGMEDKPLKLYGSKLLKKMKKHGFNATDLKDLPNAINDPIMIFKGNRPNGFAILVEIVIGYNNVLAILETGKGEDIDFNMITSAYGKARKGINNWINEGKLLYENKEKSLDYLRDPAPIAGVIDSQGEKTSSVNSGASTINIVKNFVNAIFLALSFCFAQQNGFSYWWQSDGLIDYAQMTELNALDGDQELWCALSELYVGREAAEEAGCEFEVVEKPAKQKKIKKIWKVNLNGGAYLDTNGNLKKKFAKIAGSIKGFSGETRIRESKDTKGTLAFKHGIFYAKGGDLTDKYRGVLSEFNLSELKLGAEWLHRENKNDSSWIFGKFSKSFWEKRVYAGGNMRIVAPYFGGNKLWSRTWQGFRFWNWNLRVTEIAVTKENENTLDFVYIAERKKSGARLAFEHDKNKSAISAGFKPVIKGTDSLWAKAEYPLRLRLGLNKKIQYVQVSNSLLLKETWKQGKPLEFRSESKIKIPLTVQPLFTLRWTANFSKNRSIDLKQLYLGAAVGF